MTELGEIFAELGISHYLHDFIEQGFDTWDTILDIKESDFDALGVKLGHRRKLQRRIANSRGLSADRALESPPNPPLDDRNTDDQRSNSSKAEGKESVGSVTGSTVVQGAKRKYRRHPKPDDNAPERPPSAYVLFSNKMREDLKGRNLSFTEIAKLVGEHWQNLTPQDKEPFEVQASTLKETYNTQLAGYKKTDNYRNYMAYLAEFKAKQQSNQQPASDSDAAKRPKLEPHRSTASTGTTSSGGVDTPGTSNAGSVTLQQDQWSSNPANKGFSAIDNRGHATPPPVSGAVLPGYRESIYGSAHQALPWRDGPREEGAASLQQLSRTPVPVDRRLSQPTVADTRNLTGSAQHSHRTGHSPIPPLLSSESTNMSSASSGSTSSSAYFTPRTPMEPPLDRAMPLPSLYAQKSTGNFDNQLPPIRPPSLSPQTTTFGSQQSPGAMHPNVDFPSTIPPLRGYGPLPPPGPVPQNDTRQREHPSSSRAEDSLDPVEALLKASDIVNRNSENRS